MEENNMTAPSNNNIKTQVVISQLSTNLPIQNETPKVLKGDEYKGKSYAQIILPITSKAMELKHDTALQKAGFAAATVLAFITDTALNIITVGIKVAVTSKFADSDVKNLTSLRMTLPTKEAMNNGKVHYSNRNEQKKDFQKLQGQQADYKYGVEKFIDNAFSGVKSVKDFDKAIASVQTKIEHATNYSKLNGMDAERTELATDLGNAAFTKLTAIVINDFQDKMSNRTGDMNMDSIENAATKLANLYGTSKEEMTNYLLSAIGATIEEIPGVKLENKTALVEKEKKQIELNLNTNTKKLTNLENEHTSLNESLNQAKEIMEKKGTKYDNAYSSAFKLVHLSPKVEQNINLEIDLKNMSEISSDQLKTLTDTKKELESAEETVAAIEKQLLENVSAQKNLKIEINEANTQLENVEKVVNNKLSDEQDFLELVQKKGLNFGKKTQKFYSENNKVNEFLNDLDLNSQRYDDIYSERNSSFDDFETTKKFNYNNINNENNYTQSMISDLSSIDSSNEVNEENIFTNKF